ncbi:MAG: circularly permuted type 2 ATP-grasp protein, partial [Pseudomonadota bacterium]|nr:circularly permuted type 2 ATP-grasp protein [Pseudomonadota bacterium]
MRVNWKTYNPGTFFDEIISSPGYARKPAKKLASHLRLLTHEELLQKKNAAELAIKTMGISFTVYSDAGNIDREWPMDIIPRLIAGSEWDQTSEGLRQRLVALNCFIDDIYNQQKILKDKIVPAELILNSGNFRKQCLGLKPKHRVWAHICGTDLIKGENGKFYVLEDNLRVPSGVSYMVENRRVTKRTFPELFADNHSIRPVADYPAELLDMLVSLSPRQVKHPEVVVLTPGVFNSAYFEHSYLAQRMGAELVEGGDLLVDDDKVYMRTVAGLSQVDVIYRRIDDLFLDPLVFRKDSVLGV